MDSREILTGSEPLFFLFDAESLEKQGLDGISKLLRYRWFVGFDYLRTPYETNSDKLNSIKTYDETTVTVRGDKRKIYELEERIIGGNIIVDERIERILDTIDFRTEATVSEKICLVHTFQTFGDWENGGSLLVTSSPPLLENRRKLDKEFNQFRQNHLHIVSPTEASELAGIYLRDKGDFIFYPDFDKSSSHGMDRTLWNQGLLNNLIPRYGESEHISSAFERFRGIFIAIDKMGVNYYSGRGHETNLMTRYHFNNSISLMSGIFDALALYTREKYNFDIEDRHTNLWIRGEPVLQALKDVNKEAWEFVHSNHELLEIIRRFRNDIIHNTGLFTNGPILLLDEDETPIEFVSHAIGLSRLSKSDLESFKSYYGELNDSVRDYDPFTDWGVLVKGDEIEPITAQTYINPYQFAKKSTKELASFSDEYLNLLDVKESSKDSERHELLDPTKLVDKYGMSPLL